MQCAASVFFRRIPSRSAHFFPRNMHPIFFRWWYTGIHIWRSGSHLDIMNRIICRTRGASTYESLTYSGVGQRFLLGARSHTSARPVVVGGRIIRVQFHKGVARCSYKVLSCLSLHHASYLVTLATCTCHCISACPDRETIYKSRLGASYKATTSETPPIWSFHPVVCFTLSLSSQIQQFIVFPC